MNATALFTYNKSKTTNQTMTNKNNTFEIKFRTKVDSTAYSDCSNSDNDELDDCLESIFEWFAQNNIVKGSPEQHYEEHIKCKRDSLRNTQTL